MWTCQSTFEVTIKKVTGKMKYQMMIELQDYIQCLFFAEQVYDQSFYIMTSMWFVCDF